MGKSKKSKSKNKKNEDFKKIKLKVGRKIKPANETIPVVRVGKVLLRDQFSSKSIKKSSIKKAKNTFIITEVNQVQLPRSKLLELSDSVIATLKQCLTCVKATDRKDGLIKAREMISIYGRQLVEFVWKEAMDIICPMLSEQNTDVRTDVLKLFRCLCHYSNIKTQRLSTSLTFPILPANLCRALSNAESQVDATVIVKLVVSIFPKILISYSDRILETLLALVQKQSQSLSVVQPAIRNNVNSLNFHSMEMDRTKSDKSQKKKSLSSSDGWSNRGQSFLMQPGSKVHKKRSRAETLNCLASVLQLLLDSPEDIKCEYMLYPNNIMDKPEMCHLTAEKCLRILLEIWSEFGFASLPLDEHHVLDESALSLLLALLNNIGLFLEFSLTSSTTKIAFHSWISRTFGTSILDSILESFPYAIFKKTDKHIGNRLAKNKNSQKYSITAERNVSVSVNFLICNIFAKFFISKPALRYSNNDLLSEDVLNSEDQTTNFVQKNYSSIFNKSSSFLMHNDDTKFNSNTSFIYLNRVVSYALKHLNEWLMSLNAQLITSTDDVQLKIGQQLEFFKSVLVYENTDKAICQNIIQSGLKELKCLSLYKMTSTSLFLSNYRPHNFWFKFFSSLIEDYPSLNDSCRQAVKAFIESLPNSFTLTLNLLTSNINQSIISKKDTSSIDDGESEKLNIGLKRKLSSSFVIQKGEERVIKKLKRNSANEKELGLKLKKNNIKMNRSLNIGDNNSSNKPPTYEVKLSNNKLNNNNISIEAQEEELSKCNELPLDSNSSISNDRTSGVIKNSSQKDIHYTKKDVVSHISDRHMSNVVSITPEYIKNSKKFDSDIMNIHVKLITILDFIKIGFHLGFSEELNVAFNAVVVEFFKENMEQISESVKMKFLETIATMANMDSMLFKLVLLALRSHCINLHLFTKFALIVLNRYEYAISRNVSNLFCQPSDLLNFILSSFSFGYDDDDYNNDITTVPNQVLLNLMIEKLEITKISSVMLKMFFYHAEDWKIFPSIFVKKMVQVLKKSDYTSSSDCYSVAYFIDCLSWLHLLSTLADIEAIKINLTSNNNNNSLINKKSESLKFDTIMSGISSSVNEDLDKNNIDLDNINDKNNKYSIFEQFVCLILVHYISIFNCLETKIITTSNKMNKISNNKTIATGNKINDIETEYGSTDIWEERSSWIKKSKPLIISILHTFFNEFPTFVPLLIRDVDVEDFRSEALKDKFKKGLNLLKVEPDFFNLFKDYKRSN